MSTGKERVIIQRQDGEVLADHQLGPGTYGIGRELTTHDRYVVAEMLKESATNEHRLLDMIITICQSSLFRGTPDKSTDTP